MFSVFAPKTPAPFKPILASLPPRAVCNSTCNEQWQSPFFSKLPAEIRNEIYMYTFAGETRELLSIEAHPLSMLLTCHKANHEATNLAFSRHTFPISDNIDATIFVSLRNATAHLTPQQVDAITALSYDQHRQYLRCNVLGTAKIVANAVLLFPNLEHFEIRNLRSIHSDSSRNWYAYHDVGVTAVQKYVPQWFTYVLKNITNGRAHAWQPSERWTIDWPQLKNNDHLHFLQDTDSQGNPFFSLFMSPDAVGTVRGVQMCPCQCGNVEWSAADLVQDSGRKIAIDFVYHGPDDRPLPKMDPGMLLKARIGPRAIVLKEGAAPMNRMEDAHESFGTVTTTTTTSLEYEGDEAYWEELRTRNGNLGALCRGLWRHFTQERAADELPGSKSLGEGDWARIKEMAENKNVNTVQGFDETDTRRSCARVKTECKVGSLETRQVHRVDDDEASNV